MPADALMGRSRQRDRILLLATALAGAVLGALAAAFLAKLREIELIERIEETEKKVKGLRLQLKNLGERVAAAEAQPPPPRTSGQGYRGFAGGEDWASDFGAAAAAPMRPAPETAPRPSHPASDANRRLAEAGRRYAELVEGRGKARDFAEAIATFDRRLGLHFEPQAGLVTLPYREDSPNQLLIALGLDGEFIVVPTYEYISNFRVAFTAPGKNPAVVSEVFDLHQDGSGRLRLIDPAEIALREDGSAAVRKKGQLGGYVG